MKMRRVARELGPFFGLKVRDVFPGRSKTGINDKKTSKGSEEVARAPLCLTNQESALTPCSKSQLLTYPAERVLGGN